MVGGAKQCASGAKHLRRTIHMAARIGALHKKLWISFVRSSCRIIAARHKWNSQSGANLTQSNKLKSLTEQ